MITKTVFLPSLDTGVLLLGYRGENNHVRYNIRCDSIFDDYPDCEVTMLVKAPDGTVYPKIVEVDAPSVYWVVDASDTAKDGNGQIQLTFTDDGEVIKTVIVGTNILASLVGSGEPAPDPVVTWEEEASQKLAQVDTALSNLTDEKVKDMVDEWLTENITNPDSPPLDRSLSLSTAAAPADMVGDIEDSLNNADDVIGIVDIVSKNLSFTSRGIDYTVEQNGVITLNGTATGATYVKITNDIASRASEQSAWQAERMGVETGKRYIMFVTPVRGTFSNAVSASVILRDSTGASTTSLTYASSADGLYNGTLYSSEFYSTATNCAYTMLVVRSGAKFENVQIRVGFIDVNRKSIFDSKPGSGFYDEVRRAENHVYKNANDEPTTYYYCIVPKNDTFGNLIPINAVFFADGGPLDYGVAYHTTLNTNAGMGSNGGNCAVITDGVVTRESDYPTDTSLPIYSYLTYVGFDADRNILEFPLDTTTATMLSAGVKNACVAYYKLVEDGEPVDISGLPLPEGHMGQKMRMCLFERENGDIGFFACDGESPQKGDYGMTPSEVADMVISLEAVNAWMLDGGGSTSLIYKGCKQNKNKDQSGQRDREIKVLWAVPHRCEYTPVQYSSSQIGEEKERVVKMFNAEINSVLSIINEYLPAYPETDGTYKLTCTVSSGVPVFSWESV